jgi:orotate phosphoribosyltransferase
MTVAADAQELIAQFVRLLVDNRVLLRGKFILKSGAESDYFINFGALETAAALRELGACYADKIQQDVGLDAFDVVFGPSYKGIPIALATALALHERWGVDKAYSFDRKLEKDHGEGGLFLGRTPQVGDRVLIVDDVITDGGTKLAMLELLRTQTAATVVGVLVGVDRSAPGTVAAFEQETGVRLWSIASAEALRDTSDPQAAPGGGPRQSNA